MADPTNTQQVSTLPSHVTTLTIVAMVVGYLIATFGGLITVYQATHPIAAWEGPAIAALGVVLALVSHFGYVKGQALTQNAVINGLIASGSALLLPFLTVLVSKGTLSDATKAALAQLEGQLPPTVAGTPIALPVPAQAVAAALADATKPPAIAPVVPK